MDRPEGVPVVVALAVTDHRHTRSVVVLCPYCERKHSHGWGYDTTPEPGLRESHCAARRVAGRWQRPTPGPYYVALPVEAAAQAGGAR